MKKFALILVVLFSFALCSCNKNQNNPNEENSQHEHEYIEGICSCGEKDPNYVAPHTHEYVEGVCSCGEKDPSYVASHTHEYVDGVCSCGEKDPNYVAPHTHEYIDGVCSCGEKDPSYQEDTSAEDAAFFEKVESYVRSFIKTNTRKDLKLKTSYYSTGATISYVSSHPEFVTDDGKYIEHEYDEEVTLSATISWEGKTYTFDINITSTGIPDEQKLEKVKVWLEKYVNSVDLHEGLVLPTTHPDYGGRIRWVCENAGLIVDYKTLNLPEERGNYYLMAEIHFYNAYEIVKYPVTLMPTKLTKEERIVNFIKQSAITTKGDFINLYEGSSVIINTDYLIDINDEKIVSHLHSGIKPTVPQSFLDEEIYPGYKLNNKEQVVWIVVHESGMNTTGVNAEYLARSQWNSAYYGSSRNASWNYQVDDHSVYQSYGDDIYAWHASSRRGNSNSIGIEMCVNPDGEYNVSMRNDARLIAYFLHKYNLGMLNVKQHYNFDPNGKNCPEIMRNTFRWFELLGMIAREYTSQELLKDVDVSYKILSENLKERSLAGIYEIVDNQKVDVEVTVCNQTFNISIENE